MKREQFEFSSKYRGVMARLQWEQFEVVVVDWPGGLLSMLRADVLGPKAHREATALLRATAGAAPTAAGRQSGLFL